MHCFYCKNIPEKEDFAELDKRESAHLFKTLRAKAGEIIALVDGRGTSAEAKVGNDKNILIISRKNHEEPRAKLFLYLTPPKKQKMDSLLKQCAETGVWKIIPMITERSVSTPEKESTLERWKSILLEGCKQSGNPFTPEIELPIKFNTAIARVKESGQDAYFGSPRSDIQPDWTEKPRKAWFVGPEGGFSEKEENIMLETGVKPLRIGPWIMRVETAAICGAALFIYEKRFFQ
jgi:16S rRNA (uracil1498-N3)-methyltransferase